ncbi:unnamed protein product [Closterium sp. NIES-65]|nr:unnamed protein product [Closterium sp. NIES-65]
MDDPEVLLPSIERRTKQLRQQEQMLREAVTAASRRKETSAAALRSAEDAHQHLLRDRFPALNAQVNAQLDAMAAHAAAIAAFLSPARPGSLAMVAGVEPLLEAQEEVALQHEVWKRRQFDEGPSRAVALEGLGLYSPCDLNDLDAAVIAGDHGASIDTPGLAPSHHHPPFPFFSHLAPPTARPTDAIYRCNIRELKHVHDLDDLYLSLSPSYPFLDYTLLPVPLLPVLSTPCSSTYRPRRCHAQQGGGGGAALRGSHGGRGSLDRQGEGAGQVSQWGEGAGQVSQWGGQSSSSGGSSKGTAGGAGQGGAGGAEERRRRRRLEEVRAEVARARGVVRWGGRWGGGREELGKSVSKLCKEKARLQDAMVYAGDYELKMQRQRFYLAKMHQLLTQQYWQLAVNVALHGAVLLDAHHLERTWQLLLQLHCDTSAAISDSETRKAAYKALASQATAPTAPTAPTSFSSSQFPPPSSSLPLPASSPLWPALLSALSPPAAQGEPLGAAGGGVAQAAGGREGESGGEVVERLVEGLRGRAQGEGERVQQGVEQSERLLAHMAGMQAAMVELLSSPHATPSSTAAHAMPLHLSPPALVDERLRVERQLSDDVAPAIDRLADEWQTTQRSAVHAPRHGIRQRLLHSFFSPAALPCTLLHAHSAQGAGGEGARTEGAGREAREAQGGMHGQERESRGGGGEGSGMGMSMGMNDGGGRGECMGMQCGMHVGMGMGMEEDDDSFIF